MLVCVREYDDGPLTESVNVGVPDAEQEIPRLGEVQLRVTAMLLEDEEY